MSSYDALRLAFVYIHLLACCIALGSLLTEDAALLWNMVRGKEDKGRILSLHGIAFVVATSLGVLWVTGGGIIVMDMFWRGDGWSYLLNPKIQAKIIVVSLLSLNGGLLHWFAMPWMMRYHGLLGMTDKRMRVCTAIAAVSGVSWLYAAFLGIGRPLNWKYPLDVIMCAYPVLILVGWLGLLAAVELGRVMKTAKAAKD